LESVAGFRLIAWPAARMLIIDDTAVSTERSFGVALQYDSPLGKMANCQALVSLTLAPREVPEM
jgi:SRSO17 transposase